MAEFQPNQQQPTSLEAALETTRMTTAQSNIDNQGDAALDDIAKIATEKIKAEEDSETIVEKSPQDRFCRFNKEIGRGSFKVVYSAYDTVDGVEVAWNVVQLNDIDKAHHPRVMNEVKLLKTLDHPNIIKCTGSWYNKERHEIIFITELVTAGSLKRFLTRVGSVRYKIIRKWSMQILSALEYLHGLDNPVLHRDLKCDNIFINSNTGNIVLGDFGLSRDMKKGGTSAGADKRGATMVGTPEFMAPEMFSENYDERVDIYAFGMAVLEMISGEYPYTECSTAIQIINRVSSNIYPEILKLVTNDDAKAFVKVCLRPASIDDDTEGGGDIFRPTAKKLLTHEFLLNTNHDEEFASVEGGGPDTDTKDTSQTGTKNASDKVAQGNNQPVNGEPNNRAGPRDAHAHGSESVSRRRSHESANGSFGPGRGSFGQERSAWGTESQVADIVENPAPSAGSRKCSTSNADWSDSQDLSFEDLGVIYSPLAVRLTRGKHQLPPPHPHFLPTGRGVHHRLRRERKRGGHSTARL
jgi:WNK lysine deficient protein kinase